MKKFSNRGYLKDFRILLAYKGEVEEKQFIKLHLSYKIFIWSSYHFSYSKQLSTKADDDRFYAVDNRSNKFAVLEVL